MLDEFIDWKDLLRTRLADRFEGWELIEYLQIPVEDVIEKFSENIEEAKDDLEEFMQHGR